MVAIVAEHVPNASVLILSLRQLPLISRWGLFDAYEVTDIKQAIMNLVNSIDSKAGISVDEDLAPIGECAFCGHKHKVGVCEVCSTEFDPDWEGLVDEETGLELCEYHSDLDNYD